MPVAEQKGPSDMDILIWILVIIAVVAVIVWLLRRNSAGADGTTAGSSPADRHPGHQPGSGSSDPIMQSAPPVSTTPAATSAGAAGAAGVTGPQAHDAVPDDEDQRRRNGGDDEPAATAPSRPGEHTTAADDAYASSLEQEDNADEGHGLAGGPERPGAAAAEGADGYTDTGGVGRRGDTAETASVAGAGAVSPGDGAVEATGASTAAEPSGGDTAAEPTGATTAAEPGNGRSPISDPEDAADDTEGGSNPGQTGRNK